MNRTYWPNIDVPRGRFKSVVDSFVFTFFIDHETERNAANIEAVLHEFIEGPARGQLHFYVDDEGETEPLPSDPMNWITRVMRHADPQEMVDLRLIDQEQPGNRCEARYFHDPQRDPDWPDQKGFLCLRIGQTQFAGYGVESTIAFVDKIAGRLPYSYGYAGPALSYGHFFADALPYLPRHPGFDVLNPATASVDVGDSMLGVYWLNLLGPRLSSRLGDFANLRAALPTEVRLHAEGHGRLRLQVGDVPQVGDVNRNDALPTYRQLASLMKPHLRTPGISYFVDAEGNADMPAQIAWHERFLRG